MTRRGLRTPPDPRSALVFLQRVLDGVEDIAFCTLTGRDVVRHSLVARIVEAYERAAAHDRSREKRADCSDEDGEGEG